MPRKGQSAPGAVVDDGRRFWKGSSGRWAGERLLESMASGQGFQSSALRTADTLRKDEWIHLDEALVEEGIIRLKAVADLMAAGLTIPVANGLGKTVFQYEKVTDMEPAITSLDGMAQSEGDRQEFSLNNLPLPITHKDFFINLRTLSASRERGESLDTMQARVAGRLVSERVEQLLFDGGPQFGGLDIPGYRTHSDRNQVNFSNGSWAVVATADGEDILTDVLAMISAAEGDRMYGPYRLYVPSNFSMSIERDFKANSDKSIRQRLMEVDRLVGISICDQLAADEAVLVQMTRDVVALVTGEPLQTIQWDIMGGFQINFKAYTIMVPLIRSDNDGRSGVVHMTVAP